MNLPLRCRCGQSHASLDLAPGSGIHLACYCGDCRAFARALERSDILDGAGGTEIFVTTPSCLTLTSGLGQLRCLRLSKDGMLRWYWACCNTPLANTMHQPGIPAVSIHGACMGKADTPILGPLTRLNARSALGSVAPGAHQATPPSMMLKIVLFLIRARWRGAHQPNPLFSNGQPVLEPRILSAAERLALGH